MKRVATVVLMVGIVLIGFPLSEVFVWLCALMGAFVFSHFLAGLIWMRFVWRARPKEGI